MKTARLIIGLVLSFAMLSCGTGTSEDAAGSNSTAAEFKIVSSWEPTLDGTPKGTRIGYSLIVENTGSGTDEVSCEILMRGEPLPGESKSATINPDEEEAVDGEAHVDLRPNDVALKDLTPVCD